MIVLEGINGQVPVMGMNAHRRTEFRAFPGQFMYRHECRETALKSVNQAIGLVEGPGRVAPLGALT